MAVCYDKLFHMMIDKDIKQLAIADGIGITKQNFNDQLRRDNFRISDVVKIADILGYDTQLTFIDRASGNTTNA